MADGHQLAALRRERKRLMERAAMAGAARRQAAIARRIDTAYLDALTLITLHVGGGDVGRTRSGLPQRRWAHAVALLRLAGLAEGRCVAIRLQSAPQATLEALQAATETARRNPASWVARMPAYNRPTSLQAGR